MTISKDTEIRLRVNSKIKKKFAAYAKKQKGETMSSLLEGFINKTISK